MPKKQKVPPSVQQALHEQAVKGKVKQPDLAKLVARFFEHAGGETQVAKLLYEEFVASAPGGVVRQRIMDMILRGLKYVNDKAGPPDDLGMLSEEDLERELASLVEAAGEEVASGEHPQHPGPASQPSPRANARDAGPALRGADPAPGDPGSAQPPGRPPGGP